MEYISTTSLSNLLDIPTNELFGKLKNLGWTDRKNDKWVLTELGKQKGGQTRISPKFGEYIVWPENLSLDNNYQSKNKTTLLNSTTLGEHFNISNQRMNLILSELGWIEKDVTGWILTKLGQVFCGKQVEHETSGKKYVLWPNEILTNKHLLKVLTEPLEDVEKVKEIPSSDIVQTTNNAITKHNDFRGKFPAEHRAIDGHYVRSKAEMLIDNWLYQYGLVHAYERRLPIDEEVYCDFYLPSGNGRPQAVYIEFWGLENDPKYAERKKKKIEIYNREGLALIQMTDADIQNIDDILPKKLLQYKIKVG